ncbi:hypothetical protein DC094_15000 [Pelagibaculum spongiae]|uniref:Uncharacterized protein n=1 Tax=Pelagibaculum spongiae TaxID=2080658 RepID=A0A2V1H042_9GAMM|nr:hypothetical protein DC094_15000 [Pelagibaculum spongiae]
MEFAVKKAFNKLFYGAKSFITEAGEKQLTLRAAALSWTAMFALVPLITVGFGILGSLPQLAGVEQILDQYLRDHLLPASASQVLDKLKSFADHAQNLALPGMAILAVTALALVYSLEGHFNALWDAPSKRPIVARFTLFWTLLTLGPLLAGSALVFASLGLPLVESATSKVGFQLPGTGLLSWLMIGLLLTLVYLILPNCKVGWRNAIASGLIISSLLKLLQWGVSLLALQGNNYQLIYGVFASVPLFLLWMHASFFLLLVGVILSRYLSFTKSLDI